MACDFVAALPGVQDSAAPGRQGAAPADPERLPAQIPRSPTAAELLRSCTLEGVLFADLRKLLDQGEFAKLDATLDRLLEGHRKNSACEAHLWDAMVFLAGLEFPLLDSWAEARPDSWGAFTARGRRWVDAGYAHRGSAFANKVTEAQWSAMRDAFARAEIDLNRALELEPDGFVAYGTVIHMLMSSGNSDQIRERLDSLLARDPYNFGVRWNAMKSLSPYWGGSIEEMRQVASDAQRFADVNPRLRKLPGYAEAEAASIDWRAKRYREAARGYRRALAHGADSNWYAQLADCQAEMGAWRKLIETSDEWIADLGEIGWPRQWRGRARAELGDLAGALEDLDQAHAQAPQSARTLRLRGQVRMRSGRLPEAAEDFRLALEIEPGNAWAIEQLQALGAAEAQSAPVPATTAEGTSVPRPQGDRRLPALSRLDLKPPAQ
jgi:tetratricopeptide (TPR) repeat protein